jgi:hypothetical protein
MTFSTTILFLLILFVHRFLADSSDLNYNIGDYSIDCPTDEWLNVDAHCFFVLKDNIYSWNEAAFRCSLSE